jgi:hypothetical protein
MSFVSVVPDVVGGTETAGHRHAGIARLQSTGGRQRVIPPRSMSTIRTAVARRDRVAQMTLPTWWPRQFGRLRRLGG